MNNYEREHLANLYMLVNQLQELSEQCLSRIYGVKARGPIEELSLRIDSFDEGLFVPDLDRLDRIVNPENGENRL